MKLQSNSGSHFRIRLQAGVSLLLVLFLVSACQKQVTDKIASGEVQSANSKNGEPNGEVLNWYTGLSSQTMWELQQARAATAKYRFDTVNAYKDGYRNISVDVENMGHHFLKLDLVNGEFDYRRPQLLVYNENEQGKMELVAVEYAVPINLPEPAGFSGNHDVWDHNTGFGLWLLHAWVWKYNPEGVFNPFNPDVHLH